MKNFLRKLKKETIYDWHFQSSEFYLFLSLVIHFNKNEEVSWLNIRVNLFTLELNWTFYYNRNKTLHVVK